jgi:hypothetical protein
MMRHENPKLRLRSLNTVTFILVASFEDVSYSKRFMTSTTGWDCLEDTGVRFAPRGSSGEKEQQDMPQLLPLTPIMPKYC